MGSVFPEEISIPELCFARRVTYAPCYSENWHAIREHQIFFILSGAMTLELSSGMRYHAAAGDTLFLPANVMHHDKFHGKNGPELLHLRFLWQDAETFFTVAQPDCVRHFPPAVQADIAAQFRLLYLPGGRCDGTFNTVYQKNRIALQLGVILWLCVEQLFSSQQCLEHKDNDKIRFDEARRFIADQLENHLTLESVARHMQISTRTLTRIFRRCSGESFHEHLQELRLNEARRLLETGSVPVAEIAQKLGFCDSGYFGKVFKKRFGFPPGKFR